MADLTPPQAHCTHQYLRQACPLACSQLNNCSQRFVTDYEMCLKLKQKCYNKETSRRNLFATDTVGFKVLQTQVATAKRTSLHRRESIGSISASLVN